MNQDQPHRRDERKRSRPKRKRRWSRRWRLNIRQALAISLLIHGLVLLIRFNETGFGFAAGSPKGGPPPLVAERRFQVPDIRIVLAPPEPAASSAGFEMVAPKAPPRAARPAPVHRGARRAHGGAPRPPPAHFPMTSAVRGPARAPLGAR